jgi:pimeloyl-ACP methyl ester carboxylesterase
VFQNYSRQKALAHVLRLVDSNHDGLLSPLEAKQAKVIIFGHSWGGTDTVMLARGLQRQHIPVLLTVQGDRIAKPVEENFTIPANVANAVNFLSVCRPAARTRRPSGHGPATHPHYRQLLDDLQRSSRQLREFSLVCPGLHRATY